MGISHIFEYPVFPVLDPFKDVLVCRYGRFLHSFFLWLIISPSSNKGIEIVGDQNRIDERDVIFARFDLQEGTQVLKDYYDNHPGFGSKDRQIRQLPDLFAPSHNKKDPILFSLAAAEFEFLEHQLTQVAGETKNRADNTNGKRKCPTHQGGN